MIQQASSLMSPKTPSTKCMKVEGEGEGRGAGAHPRVQARIGNKGGKADQGDRPAAPTLEAAP